MRQMISAALAVLTCMTLSEASAQQRQVTTPSEAIAAEIWPSISGLDVCASAPQVLFAVEQATHGEDRVASVGALQILIGDRRLCGSVRDVLAQASRSLQLEIQRAENVQADHPVADCAPGYFWRLAAPVDRICVTLAEHERVQFENQDAGITRLAGGGAYGPNTCRSGYVWRAAFPNDLTCVTPERRTLAARENAAHSSRLNSQTPGTSD